MKVTKPMIIAALVAGNLLAWDLALRAGETNTPPAKPAAGAPPADQRPPRGGFGGFDRRMEQLDLTADQKPKVQAIMDAQRQKMQELRQDTSLTREDRQPKFKALMESTDAQLKAILTPEQYEKWQKMPGPGRGGVRNNSNSRGEKAGDTNAPAAPPKK